MKQTRLLMGMPVTLGVGDTAAFGTGREGSAFIEEQDGYEGNMIERDHQATFSNGFMRYVV